MQEFDPSVLKQLYVPSSNSHKGQNGKVMLIAGSKLFHSASLWPLTVMSRICDMVFYASVTDNNEIVMKMKEEFRNGIVVPREKIDNYIQEADAVLIGPGLPREEGVQVGDDDTKILTESLLQKYPDKKWVIDGGSLQTIDPEVLKGLNQTPILTPHRKEFETLFGGVILSNSEESQDPSALPQDDRIRSLAQEYRCVVLLKGEKDIICSPTECVTVLGGNAGMTKGGTGDVLAGLVTSLYAKNDAFISATAASYINKKAGESLFERVGIYFNASDLADEIPKVMKTMI